MGIEHVDVLVVGAGPTGLTAAGDLARLGRHALVIERWPSLNPSSRAFATMARTLELLDSRGLADELIELGHAVGKVRLFAGAELDLSHLRSRYPFVLITPQTNVDQALGRYAAAQGARIERGWEASALTQDDEGVTVIARPKEGAGLREQRTIRARYVIGADGAHSTVRRLVGASFPGKSVLSSLVLADVKLAGGPSGSGLTLGSTAECFVFLVPYNRRDADGSWYRSMTWHRQHQVAQSEPISSDEVAAVLNEAMGRDLGVVDISWRSRFHCEERQVEHYRIGRVLLAGDAAHVHSPMGGQGMNTGIQDAANLAWKLDAALSGADDAVLDSYESERHPIGRRVLLQSGMMMRGVTLQAKPARWLRDRIVPRLMRIGPVRDFLAGSFAGTELCYARRPGDHALVGTRASEVPLQEGRLSVVQRSPGFVLIREQGRAALPSAPVLQAQRTDGGPALLVRPDGYIAWAGASSAVAGWQRALERWHVQRGAA